MTKSTTPEKKSRFSIWYRYLKARPWLFFGSIFLIGAWIWEKFDLEQYRSDLQQAWAKYADFRYVQQHAQFSKIGLDTQEAEYAKEPNALTLANMGQAIGGYIIANYTLIESGETMVEFDSKAHINASIETKAAIAVVDSFIKDQDYKSLRLMSDSVAKFSSTHNKEAQPRFYARIKSLDRKLAINQWIQVALYVIGIALVSVNSAISNINDEKESEIIFKNLSILIHRKQL